MVSSRDLLRFYEDLGRIELAIERDIDTKALDTELSSIICQLMSAGDIVSTVETV